MIVADSDVLIDSLRGEEQATKRIDLELRSGGLATTVVTVFELMSGARSDRQVQKVSSLLAPLSVLHLDRAASLKAAEVRVELEAAGQGLALADYLIAGICLTRNAVLLSRNEAHLGRVRGLRLGRLSTG